MFFSHLGEVTPVDCAKKCLAARTNSVDSCNAFTIVDGVCTLGNIKNMQSAGDHFKKNCQKPKSSGFTGEQLMVSVLMLNSEDEDMKITQAAQISDLSAVQISDLSAAQISDLSAVQIFDTTTTTSNLLALDSCSGTSLRTSNYIVEAFDV